MKVTYAVSIKSGFATALILFSMVVAPLLTLHVAAAAGNNGTLKVHEIGTASGTESNDPKVCAFNFEGFSFDPSQSGYLQLDPQGGSSPAGTAAGPFSFGPTDAAGYAISQDFNNGAGTTTIADGTYKATLYGKDVGGSINLNDEEAKSKVFKVDCSGGGITITPADVTFTDMCGTSSDTYTIPTTTGVLYQIGGATVAAGVYPGSGTVTVMAIADAGYVLAGNNTWQNDFTNNPCPNIPIVVGNPTFADMTCNADGSYTIEPASHVTYKVNGVVTIPGTYPVSAATSITVTAEADPGYVIVGTTSWSHDFLMPSNCGTLPGTDACPNIAGVQATVPSGMVLDINGDCITPGQGGGNPTDTTTPSTPSNILALLSVPSVLATTTQSSVKQLVNTGSSGLLNVFVGLFIIGSTAVVTIINRKPATTPTGHGPLG